MELVKQDLNEVANEVRRLISEVWVFGTERMLMIGSILKPIRDGNRYLQAGNDSFESWTFEQFGWKKSSAYNSIRAFERYGKIMVDNPELLDVMPTRAIQLLPIITTDDDAVESLHAAKELNDPDWKTYLRQRKGKVVPENCTCPPEKQVHLCQCSLCKRTYKTPPENAQNGTG